MVSQYERVDANAGSVAKCTVVGSSGIDYLLYSIPSFFESLVD